VNKPIEKPETSDLECSRCGGNVEWPCICDNKYSRPEEPDHEGNFIARVGHAAYFGAPGR
jgi:hypothetical protein